MCASHYKSAAPYPCPGPVSVWIAEPSTGVSDWLLTSWPVNLVARFDPCWTVNLVAWFDPCWTVNLVARFDPCWTVNLVAWFDRCWTVNLVARFDSWMLVIGF